MRNYIFVPISSITKHFILRSSALYQRRDTMRRNEMRGDETQVSSVIFFIVSRSLLITFAEPRLIRRSPRKAHKTITRYVEYYRRLSHRIQVGRVIHSGVASYSSPS